MLPRLRVIEAVVPPADRKDHIVRIRTILLSILVAALSLYAVPSLRAQETAPPTQPKFDPSRDAARDIAAAVAEAKKLDKRVLLDVGGEWCIWCHRLDSLFITNADLDKFLNDRYVVVKVNVSKENKNDSVLSQYPKVAGYPHLFVLDGDGKLIQSQNTGDLEEGKGPSKEKVLAFLKKWAVEKK
jgi:thiol:disulfide interchange protein